MKKIAILFAVVALSSCGGVAEKCDEKCVDSTSVSIENDTIPMELDTNKVDVIDLN